MEADNSRRTAETEKSIPELLRSFAADTTLLVRQELELVKVEFQQRATLAKGAIALTGVAALLGIGAFAAFTAMLIALFAALMPVWLAAAVVTVFYGIIGAITAKQAARAIADLAEPPKLPLPLDVQRNITDESGHRIASE